MRGTAGLLLAILLAAAAVQSPASAAPGDLPRTHRKLAGYASPSAGGECKLVAVGGAALHNDGS